MSSSDPSSWTTCIEPERMVPTWWFWQESVPATGLMHSDHFHPGWNVIRAALVPSRAATSTCVLSGERVSSGVSKLFLLRLDMVCLLVCVLGVVGGCRGRAHDGRETGRDGI